MKFHFDKKYVGWGITAFIVIIMSICFKYLIYNGKTLFSNIGSVLRICMPIIDGFVLAYILTPILNFVENRCLTPLYLKCHVKIDRKTKSRMRIFSICFTMLFVFIIVYAFIMVVIPQIYQSLQSIIISFPSYINNLIVYAEKLLADNPEIESYVTGLVEKYSTEFTTWINATLLPGMNELIKTLSLSVIGFLVAMWNLVIGIIISIYVMASKEKFIGQAKKTIYSFFSTNHANNILADMRFIHKTFGGFINGKLLDSLIIGIICYFSLLIIKTPYPLLISVIVGVTNIIPFFGPYLGAIPSALLILLIDPIQCLYFLIFILILQQFDGNILGPKILGNSTGLSGFWVIFSITLFGGLFGVVGMILGVPTFAIFYAFLRRYINNRLKEKGYPSGTTPYINLKEITEEEHQFISFENNSQFCFDTSSSEKTISENDLNHVSSIRNNLKTWIKSIIMWFKKRFNK